MSAEMVIPARQQKPLSTQQLQQQILPKWEKFLGNCSSLLIIINDSTRTTPTAQILQILLPYIKLLNYQFLVATGTHSTQADLTKLVGKDFAPNRNRIHFHDALRDDMFYLGKTSLGTEVYLNKLIQKFDKILVIGSVEPHYFAGFTGGRKAFLPGTAAYSSIQQNHKLALHPQAKLANLSANPVHTDMSQAAQMLQKDIFSIQTVGTDKILAVASGNLQDSFEKAVAAARKIFLTKLPHQFSVVVAKVNPPFSHTFYQAHKALENCKQALKPNGTFILEASCRDGVGKNDRFWQLLHKFPDHKQLLVNCSQNYVLGDHKAVKISEFLQNNHLWIISKNMKLSSKIKNLRIFPKLPRTCKETNVLIVKNAALQAII
jgi:nickel-dependent lactate racemase